MSRRRLDVGPRGERETRLETACATYRRAMASATATSLGASGASTLSQKDHPANRLSASSVRIHRAVREAEQRSTCPSLAHPLYAYSQSSGKAFPMACRAWGCPGPACGPRKKAAARKAIEIGMLRAFAANNRVRFLTLTDTSEGSMTVADLYASWHRLRIKLRRMGVLDQYAAVVEVQKRGALHLHVLATGSFIRQQKLCELSSWAGFGEVSDIREVTVSANRRRNVADYVAKELAAYVSKEGASLAEKANVRRRPVRFSRDWGCSLRAAEQLIADEIAEAFGGPRDPGPWMILRKAQDGSLLPMNPDQGGTIPPLDDD